MIDPQGTRQKSSRKLAIRLALTTLFLQVVGKLSSEELNKLEICGIAHISSRKTNKRQINSFKALVLRNSLTFFHFENKVVRAAAKVSLATVYQKHSSLRTRKSMYRG